MNEILRRECSERRKALMNMLGERAMVIVPAAEQCLRNRDTEYRYRQDSDFYYLTGFNEPEAVLCLLPGRTGGEFVLFCRKRDRAQEIWNGYRLGQEGAVSELGADQAFDILELDERMPELMSGCERIYYALGKRTSFDRRVVSWLNQVRAKARSGIRAPQELLMLDHWLHDLRLFKSSEEIRLMRKAAAISARAHERVMRMCRPGMFEYELEAELLHEFVRSGCSAPAYTTIVGGGPRGCILHYVENRAPLRDGELVLIDAGGEYESYAADITRTFPVGKAFSSEQRSLYEIVLAAQQQAIAQVQPDQHWNDPHDRAVRVLARGLLDEGILNGSLDEVLEKELYRPFYMHRTGHWLGMDVHDVGDYKVDQSWRMLEPGMVLTVEPGLYIAPDADVEERWRGIGIRIEDDVLVTRQGHEVLTEAAPKSVADIERLRQDACS